MEEAVRDAFERARALFSEAAETTSAAFIDEIQRQARQELNGFEAEAQKSVSDSKACMEAAHADLTQKVTAEQESFLRRFQNTMSGAMDAGVAEANQKVQAEFGPLLDAWKSITQNQQAELRGLYARVGEQAAETFRGRLENVSKPMDAGHRRLTRPSVAPRSFRASPPPPKKSCATRALESSPTSASRCASA